MALLLLPAARSAIAVEPPPDDFTGNVCPGCPNPCTCVCNPPRCEWYVQADGMALQRQVLHNTNIAGVALATLTPTATGTTTTPITTGPLVAGDLSSSQIVLTRDDLGKPFSAGGQILVGHTFGDSPYQIEFSYFALNQFDTSTLVSDPNPILVSRFTNFGNPVNASVDGNELVQIHELSYLENAEFNWKMLLPTPPGMALNFLLGLRYVGVREEFDYASQQSLAVGSPQNAAVGSHTVNTLWGPQIGGLLEFNVAPDTWLSVMGKGAICNNAASRNLDAQIITNGVNTDYNHGEYSQDGTAYVADLNLAIFWRPASFLTARVGYQAMWINGLVLAAENFAPPIGVLENPSIQPPLNRQGTVLYQGPYAGLELSW
jgi:hypothetical protein